MAYFRIVTRFYQWRYNLGGRLHTLHAFFHEMFIALLVRVMPKYIYKVMYTIHPLPFPLFFGLYSFHAYTNIYVLSTNKYKKCRLICKTKVIDKLELTWSIILFNLRGFIIEIDHVFAVHFVQVSRFVLLRYAVVKPTGSNVFQYSSDFRLLNWFLLTAKS